MYGYKVLILVGSLEGATRPARETSGDWAGDAFIVLDEGDELWYDRSEVKVISEPSEMDCE